MHDLTLERLKYLLEYNPLTGAWIWLNPLSRRVKKGDLAGNEDKDYIWIRIEGRLYAAHVLAWFYMTGKWCKNIVDHKDTDKVNNKWENLREATFSQNAANSFKHTTNKSGYKGVSWSKRREKWLAQITVNYKTRNLGCYDTKEEASEVYQLAAKEAFEDFTAIVNKCMV